MSCTWFARDEVFELYVRNALSPEDRPAFEEHCFACRACFDKVQDYVAMRAELAALPAEVPAPRKAGVSVWRWAWVPVAAGVVLLAGAVLWLRGPVPVTPGTNVAVATKPPAPAAPPAAMPATEPRPQPAAPVVALAVLARVEPPVYLPAALRGPQDAAAEKFEAAMRRYADGDYAGAVAGLRSAAEMKPAVAQYAFFLAICRLLTDRVEPAAAGLQKTIALGESPYLEEAHFYLAKARLRQGNIEAARTELARTIERRGRLAREARSLLAQLDALPEGKDHPSGK